MRSHENEAFVIERDTPAVIVPAGVEVTLKAGQSGFIAQALGGSFTLYIEGNLFRLSGDNADAIGKQIVKPLELPPGAGDEQVRELAWQQMRGCFDPEIPVNIVDLGLIYECEVHSAKDAPAERTISVKMTLTAPGCGMGEVLVQDVKEKIEAIPTVRSADVELVFDPPWNQSMMSEAARLQTGMM